MATRIRWALGAVAVALLVVFLLQNLQEADVNFLWFEWETRMLWALIVSAIAGALAALAFGIGTGRGGRRNV
jgi:uncharacterized integral membrane protein